MTKLGFSFLCFTLALVNAYLCGADPTSFICSQDHNGLTVQQFIQAAIDDARAKDTWVNSLTCDANNIGITLASGPLPANAEIYNSLANTTFMFLGASSITGTIPTEIGLLTNLRFLGFDLTQVSSTIPKELFIGLQKLSSLFFVGSIRGTIPSEIEQLGLLQRITMFNILLHGTILDHLSRLPSLSVVLLSNSSFSGTIPSDLFASNIRSLTLETNRFSGTFPSGLSTSKIDEIDISDNRFSGTIPADLFASKISSLDIRNNRFSGVIPMEIANLNETVPISGAPNTFRVVNCLIGGNRFTGTMPEHKCGSDIAASFIFPTESPTRSPSAVPSTEATTGPTILSPSCLPIIQPKITSDEMIFIMIAVGGILLALVTAYLIINENYRSIMKINVTVDIALENDPGRPDTMLARDLSL